MSDISFGSIYRIPISQAGANPAKKLKLKNLVESYPNGLIGKAKTGHARVSVPNSEDANFVRKLKTIGYKVFQKFEGDDVPKEKLDVYIKERLDSRDYHQLGKNPKRMSKDMKDKRRYERKLVKSEDQLKLEAKKQAELEEVTSKYIVPDKTQLQQPSKAQESLDKVQPKQVETKPQEVEKKKNRYITADKKKIMESPDYLRLKEQYGDEFAFVVFFGRK